MLLFEECVCFLKVFCVTLILSRQLTCHSWVIVLSNLCCIHSFTKFNLFCRVSLMAWFSNIAVLLKIARLPGLSEYLAAQSGQMVQNNNLTRKYFTLSVLCAGAGCSCFKVRYWSSVIRAVSPSPLMVVKGHSSEVTDKMQ